MGPTAEDVLVWKLLCRAREEPDINLVNLFVLFAGNSLVSKEHHDHTVHLRNGLHCGITLGKNAAQCTFLDQLEAPGGIELLLHHAGECRWR